MAAPIRAMVFPVHVHPGDGLLTSSQRKSSIQTLQANSLALRCVLEGFPPTEERRKNAMLCPISYAIWRYTHKKDAQSVSAMATIGLVSNYLRT